MMHDLAMMTTTLYSTVKNIEIKFLLCGKTKGKEFEDIYAEIMEERKAAERKSRLRLLQIKIVFSFLATRNIQCFYLLLIF